MYDRSPVEPPVPIDVDALNEARHGDPFAVLGAQPDEEGVRVRVWLPNARSVDLVSAGESAPQTPIACTRIDPAGLFEARLPVAQPYRLRIQWPDATQVIEDPYAYGPLLSEFDLHLFGEGRHFELGECLGAQPLSIEGVPGVRFAVWAPNAAAVSVVGDFNAWDARRHPMRLRYPAGVWELFLPGVTAGSTYKFHIHGRHGPVPWKADPFAHAAEASPKTASVVLEPASNFEWCDEAWLRDRPDRQSASAPLSIYEIHAGSWLRPDGRALEWNALGDKLIPYAQAMGFTHLELMPIAEYPFGGSWGYQPLGLFAPSARHGSPNDFREFVNRCHEAELGVIVDWVPAHFPTDEHGLARFDGTHLFEHEDPRLGFHRDWNTAIYNLARNEVRCFLISSAMWWLEHYHIDGLRVDAVASMLYRDYSRGPGEWLPNEHGGRENLEAIGFLRDFNARVHERYPDVLTIAEESTAWPGVTHPQRQGGLGFSAKWNMGWMHDSLHYISRDPVYRSYDHNALTFGLIYAFAERFVLPISHDEVVHLKRSLLGKMPGDEWQRFANLRAYLGFMWAHPGAKLLFMGCEIGQRGEWNHDGEIEWHLLEQAPHQGVQKLVRDLNRAYRGHAAFFEADTRPQSFQWIVADDAQQSVYAFLRRGREQTPPMLAVSNFTPIARHDYRIGVPSPGRWREVLNTDSALYGGSNLGNGGVVYADSVSAHGQAASLKLSLPPLATIYVQADDAQ